MTMEIKTGCQRESARWTAVETHICQNRALMGHPSFVTDRDLTTGPSLPQGVCEKC